MQHTNFIRTVGFLRERGILSLTAWYKHLQVGYPKSETHFLGDCWELQGSILSIPLPQMNTPEKGPY